VAEAFVANPAFRLNETKKPAQKKKLIQPSQPDKKETNKSADSGQYRFTVDDFDF
jgi:hypothetical protein